MKRKIIYVFLSILFLGLAIKVGINVGGTAERERLDMEYVAAYGELTASTTLVHVCLLEYLRSGANDKAEDILENVLDNDLSGLGVHLSKPQGLTDEMKGAALAAKKYREKYPMHKVHQNLAESVHRVLEGVK